jgi:FMN phosphatase YigB (HAD superfamily)
VETAAPGTLVLFDVDGTLLQGAHQTHWEALRAALAEVHGIREDKLPRVEAAGRTDGIGWQCSHQVAARILNRIGERAERTGNVAWALRAAELRLALPFTRPVLDDLRHALSHLRARMN